MFWMEIYSEKMYFITLHQICPYISYLENKLLYQKMDVFVIGQLNSEYQDMQSSIFVSKSQAGSTEYIVHVDVAETAKVELSISKPEQIFNLFPNNI